MLKALELHGFKSFADKTRFEFPDGITVVVGPNGSGKSNVVDAIRWVLGEQSAKSLRGTEMADVIFKGSGNGQRRPANTAEATIVFDNSEGTLDVEATDVRVTRRVYRSGEGEYLINEEPCRLRDVRNLFRGTGVGADAYSLIEQGKVDTLLQASAKDRRAIFEEAAGISRFKAKKVESQRRLARVEQNLVRLSDIVEEVERRLKSLRNQATKARRYQEYNTRLKELRTHVGLTDFRKISVESEAVEAQLLEINQRCAALDATSTQADENLAAIDQRADAIKGEMQAIATQVTACRDLITGLESTTQVQRQTLAELDGEKSQYRRRAANVNSRAGDVLLQLEAVRADLEVAESEFNAVREKADQNATSLGEISEKLGLQQQAERDQREKHRAQLAATADLQKQLDSLESELSLAENAIDREQQRRVSLQKQLDSAKEAMESAAKVESQLREKLDSVTTQHDSADAEVKQLLEEHRSLTSDLTTCQQQRTAASERLNVLEEVERRLEGIGAGTKDLLARSKSNPIGPLSDIQGMVADLIEVKVEMAPLVDAALGDRAQYIVVTGQRLLRAMADDSIRLRGRVGVLSVATIRYDKRPLDPALAREPGVIGHATDFALVEEKWADLARYLLGMTWFVHSLDVALSLREKYDRVPWRFVTSAGEVLEADGTVFGGPRLSSGGIVSRRSELRSLQIQLKKLTEQESVLSQKVDRLGVTLSEKEQRLAEWIREGKQISDEYAHAHARAEAARQLVAQNQANHEEVHSGLQELQHRHAEIRQQQAGVNSGLGDLESLVSGLETALEEYQSTLVNLQRERQNREQSANETKIVLARSEQRVETLRSQAAQCQRDNEERGRAVADIANQLRHCESRHRETGRAILTATSELAIAYLDLQAHEQTIRSLKGEEHQILAQRQDLRREARNAREQLQELQQQQSGLTIRSGELQMKRNTIVERVRDDYGIELSEIGDELEDAGQREELESEISDLRRKLGNIGAVNMESLSELEDLESRFGSLTTQYNDLIKAKEALERIIQRINADSRRMFVETLDIIRENFQALFRRAFGGGFADIVVEEDADILDAGIDITATPPGKHSLNISLLSGGERAMTAVTLLLAIFRHRPSPFCILDEVDGPLDEANIGRFVDVLGEFLRTTKVVIVTHSKKTMSAATTLYGVTMQESGVSKRVSVQFNDVSEDGSIRDNIDDTNDADDGEAA